MELSQFLISNQTRLPKNCSCLNDKLLTCLLQPKVVEADINQRIKNFNSFLISILNSKNFKEF
jgi:hypothetical protein